MNEQLSVHSYENYQHIASCIFCNLHKCDVNHHLKSKLQMSMMLEKKNDHRCSFSTLCLRLCHILRKHLDDVLKWHYYVVIFVTKSIFCQRIWLSDNYRSGRVAGHVLGNHFTQVRASSRCHR